jgi:hypothetical protein
MGVDSTMVSTITMLSKVVCRAVSHGTPYRNECDVLFVDGLALKRLVAVGGWCRCGYCARKGAELWRGNVAESRFGTSGEWPCWYTDDWTDSMRL